MRVHLVAARIALALTISAMSGCANPASQSNTYESAPDHEHKAILAVWTQFTTGGVEARAITSGATCPSAVIDDKAIPMTTRAASSPEFPQIVCSIALPPEARRASIGGQPVVLPNKAVNRIVIFGDTGCRLKGAAVQNCNDPKAWPFAKVAALAARLHPDLVIHVGDYYYRETPCPDGRAGCKGSPFGDAWGSWRADFFEPAQSLLASAPWVFTRGNHEGCGRGAQGWFRFLDADRAPLTCPSASAPFAVRLDGLSLFVLDSADAVDDAAPTERVDAFAHQLDAVEADQHTAPIWIITHRPIWGFVPVQLGPLTAPIQLNATERAAARAKRLDHVSLIMSGHVHNFEAVSFGPERPAQLVVGSGGDQNESPQSASSQIIRTKIDSLNAKALTFLRFGVLVLDRRGPDWVGAFHDVDDHVAANCELKHRDLTCEPAPPAN